MSIRVRTNISRQLKSFERDMKRLRGEMRELKENVVDTSYRIMQDEAPVKTGELRGGIVIKERTPERARIGPTHIKARAIEYGSKSSPGRFVPAIGKRVKTGMHPGTGGHYFIERTFERTVDHVNKKISEFTRR